MTTLAVSVAAAALLAAAALALELRRRAELAGRAAHELRGPLCAARLGLDRLREADGSAALVAAIDLELERAALAVDDLAEARRGRLPVLRARRVDLGALLHEAGEGWRALAAARGVALHVEPVRRPLVVGADSLRLAQACGNLVANAIEHGAGPVHVRARRWAGTVRIEVTDAGPGLPAPLTDLVAAAGARSARRGHWLAITAAIAQRHGGRLTAAPAPRGARLVIELPQSTAPASRRSPTGLPPAIAREDVDRRVGFLPSLRLRRVRLPPSSAAGDGDRRVGFSPPDRPRRRLGARLLGAGITVPTLHRREGG
jgi:signal transduction histidine kinase